jgi:branched-chain amino acid transport system substrate-binding protein
MRRLLLATSVVLAAALSAAACSSSSSTPAAGTDSSSAPFRVMVTGGLSATGVLAANAETSVLAVQAGAKVINKEGGIDGRKVVVTVSNDAGDPTTAVTNLLNAIHSGNSPDLYLNSGPSTIPAATLPILTSNHILSFNMGPTADSFDPAKFPYNFDVATGPTDALKGFVLTMKDDGYKTVGIIHGNDAYGSVFGADAASAFQAAGFKITSNQAYDVTALSMIPQLQAIQATKPDVLIMDGYGAPVGYLLKGLQQLGWNVPILGDTSVSATSLVSTPPPTGYEGSSLVKNLKIEVNQSTVYSPSATLVNQAVKAMTSLGKIESTLILAFNYDALPLVAAAAKYEHSTTTAALAAALVKPAVQAAAKTAILSRYNFTVTNHSPQPSPGEWAFISPTLIVNGQYGHS